MSVVKAVQKFFVRLVKLLYLWDAFDGVFCKTKGLRVRQQRRT
ncbi:hypothetical protein [uncultured Parasutterella sp.]|nr:hypothetical protein [uncultured Parasutterella sp.]